MLHDNYVTHVIVLAIVLAEPDSSFKNIDYNEQFSIEKSKILILSILVLIKK